MNKPVRMKATKSDNANKETFQNRSLSTFFELRCNSASFSFKFMNKDSNCKLHLFQYRIVYIEVFVSIALYRPEVGQPS